MRHIGVLKNTVLLASVSFFIPITSTPSLAQDAPKWEGHVEAEGKISNERSIGEGSVFIPVWQDDTSMLFTDIRGKFDNKDSEEMNLGLGYRQQINNNWILGGYAFYDRRKSGNDNIFSQATIGVEAMSEDLEFRVNGYIPESTEEEIGNATSTASINGGNFQIQNYGAPKERALPGVDVEVGKGFYLPKNWEVWAYAGGYHFDASGYEDVTGPRGRVEISKNFDNGMRFTAGLESQTDDMRGGQTFGIARLRVPFSAFTGASSNAPKLSKLDQRMTSRIIRDVDIVSGEQQGELLSTEAATFELDNGTKVSSFTTLDSTSDLDVDVAAAGANSLVVLDGSNGIINTPEAVTGQTGQTIIGGGASITVTGANGTTANVTLPGSRPTVNSTIVGFTRPALYVGTDGTVQNMIITGNELGIEVNSNDRATIRDLIIRDTGDDSIRIVLSDDVMIENVSVYRPDGGNEEAIQIGNSPFDTSNNITIKNFYAEDANIGILVVDENTVNNLSLENVTMDQVGNVLETQNGSPGGTINTVSGAITATNVTGANCVNNGTITGSTLTINGVACP